MKNLLMLCILTVFFVSTETHAQNSWGAWNTMGCLDGLDYRVKCGEYNRFAKKYSWQVEFRNRYRKDIHFSFTAVEPHRKSEIKNSGKTNRRHTVAANGGIERGWFLIDATSSIYVYVNQVRFGNQDIPGTEYYNCGSPTNATGNRYGRADEGATNNSTVRTRPSNSAKKQFDYNPNGHYGRRRKNN